MQQKIVGLVERLSAMHALAKPDLVTLLHHADDDLRALLVSKVAAQRAKTQDDCVYMRGLIEISSFCKQNCLYCGIRAGNQKAQRYRLTLDEILQACAQGYALGMRTFVVQGGEDDDFDDETLCTMLLLIKTQYPDCAVTLSLGEKSRQSYQRYYDAGADRYLLRHETASPSLYQKLHPGMSFENRMRCLQDLKDIGYQVGAGFMVGLPWQTPEDLAEDLWFLKEFQPHMIGIGPFVPHSDTPVGKFPAGTLEWVLLMLSITRLLLPDALMPATTALGSIDEKGREMGIIAGANVVMPNLSPTEVRAKYALYDHKICINDDAVKCRSCIERRIVSAGFSVNMSRGDHASKRPAQ